MQKVYLLFLNDEKTIIGKLFANFDGTREAYSFEYDSEFISKYRDFYLDPDLVPYLGRQYPPNNKIIFGFILDMMPDRWGRALIDRNERVKAKKLNKKMQSLHEIDISD